MIDLIVVGLVLFLGTVAGVCNGLMDLVKHPIRWGESVFKDIENIKVYRYFNHEGWRNSYEDGWYVNKPKVRKYYKIPFLKIPVWKATLDVWHAAKSLMLWCFAISVGVMLYYSDFILSKPVTALIMIVAFRSSFGMGFTLGYYKIFKRRQ